MAETSLARQLRKLRTPQTTQLRQTHGRDSFLYGYREALNITCDAHHAIANSGLDVLAKHDPIVDKYKSLFSESSKDFERSIQNSDDNAKLDEEIEKFLIDVITPYFLLTNSHKALEWLVYKYRINEFNTDALILATLPYHETRLFSRVVQICKSVREPTSQWHWLANIATAGTHLPKSTLINQCTSNVNLLSKILNTAARFEHSSSNVYVSFCTALVVGVINASFNVGAINCVLKYVAKGLRSANTNFVSSSYVVFGFLAAKARDNDNVLTDKIVHKILLRSLKNLRRSPVKQEIEADYIKFLSLVCKHSESNLPLKFVENLPESVYARLDEKSSSLTSRLCTTLTANLNESTYATLINLLSSAARPEHVAGCLKTMIESENISKEHAHALLNFLDDNYPSEIERLFAVSETAKLKTRFPPSLYKKYHERALMKQKMQNQLPETRKRKRNALDEDLTPTAMLPVYALKDLCAIEALTMLPTVKTAQESEKLINAIFTAKVSEHGQRKMNEMMGKAWFNSLDSNRLQCEVISSIVKSYRSSPWKKKLRKFCVDGKNISAVIDSLTLLDSSSDTQRRVRTRRTINARAPIDLNNESWQQVVILLEQTPSTFANSTCLMQTCFSILNGTLLANTGGSLDYLKKLLVSTISLCVDQSDCDMKAFDIHCVLETLKYLKKREIQRETLSLVVKVSHHFQKEMQQNIVNIFGYISASMLQHNDAFTATVIDETFQTLLPCISNSKDKVRDSVHDVFIDAFDDIPSHRRLILFQNLVKLTGKHPLWYIAIRLIGKHACSKAANADNYSLFAHNLILTCDVVVQLETLIMLLETSISFNNGVLSHLGRKFALSENERREMIVLLTSTVTNVLANEKFVECVAAGDWTVVKDAFQSLIRCLMTAINSVSIQAEQRRKSVQASNNAFCRHLYKILGKVSLSTCSTVMPQ